MSESEKAFRDSPPRISFNLIVELCGGDAHNPDKELHAALTEAVKEVHTQAWEAAIEHAAGVAEAEGKRHRERGGSLTLPGHILQELACAEIAKKLRGRDE